MIRTQTNTIETIRNDYVKHETTKFEQLKALDKKVRRPAKVFAYLFGSLGAIVFGTGMCLAMKVIFAQLPFVMPVGIAVGLVGIAMVSTNYPIYKKALDSRKRKYANEVLALSDELLQN